MKTKNTINQMYLFIRFFTWICFPSSSFLSLDIVTFLRRYLSSINIGTSSFSNAMGDNPRSPPTLDLHNLFKMPKTKSLKDVSKVCKTFVHKRHHDKKHNEVILINMYIYVCTCMVLYFILKCSFWKNTHLINLHWKMLPTFEVINPIIQSKEKK